jgi:hypothetical protein
MSQFEAQSSNNNFYSATSHIDHMSLSSFNEQTHYNSFQKQNFNEISNLNNYHHSNICKNERMYNNERPFSNNASNFLGDNFKHVILINLEKSLK